ncbi:MAG: C4-type zinc ribbon domain-containing protein [Nitrospirota bacterium]
MNEQIKCLVELQRIDSNILDRKHTMDVIPSKISKAERPLKESQAALDKTKQRHSSLEKKKRAKEGELDAINEKIKKLKARTADIKTNKEYQAHLKEIESAEKERYTVEDEILLIMEELDVSSKEMESEEEKLRVEKDRLEAFKNQLDKEMLEAEKELLTLKKMRSRIVDNIDKEIYNRYIDLIESSNGIAVTEVKEAICQGCNMNIPPQLFVEIKKNEEIIHCPQCRRILYYKNNI